MKTLKYSEIEHETINVENETGITGATTIKLNLLPISDNELPTVSIVVPTHNRKDFYELIMRNWERIDYPQEKLELIILDDSVGIKEVPVMFRDNKQIRYIINSKKMSIGEKRNILAKYAKNEYIVHMDDDDWYPPESVVCRIRILLEFKKRTGKDYCFGCSKVLCFDLIGCQMFESFDMSDEGLPSTLSESTMAYSKKYWETKGFDNSSIFAECLPFVVDRQDTLCVAPSVFIVTQFSHGNNTVNRRITKNSVSQYNSIRFEKSLSVYDSTVFNNLRAKIICKIPEYKEAISFLQKYHNYDIEKFKKVWNHLDKSIKTNPLIVDLYQEKMINKTTSSGKDVVYYCGPGTNLNFSNEWCPESKNLGGSEEAVVNLSKELVKYGYNVTVYCVLEGENKNYGGVNYKNYYEWIPKNKQDITIIWRDPSNCKKEINSKKILLDIHDALDHILFKELDKDIKIMLKSKYHAEILKLKDANIIPNGIYPLVHKEKIKNLMVCTSSPDRCIRALLRALPIIRKQIPDAEIHWAYGFKSGISKGGMETDPRSKEWVKESKILIKNTEGFKDLGRLSQSEVNELYAKADVFLYPTCFPEIDCISLTKSMSACCIPIVTPSGAISEKLGINRQIAKLINDKLDYSLEEGKEFNDYVNSVIFLLQQPRLNREQISKIANDNYNWETITKKWIEILENN